ncbi:unnamed protein product, partial [Didymodactylos carnosus]
ALHERYLSLYILANQNPKSKTCPRCNNLYSLDNSSANATIIQTTKKVLKKKNEYKKIPTQVQCSECSFIWCFQCWAPWHDNLTCKQFAKGDKQLRKWLNQKNDEQWNARKCPKCSSLIQRAGGCPHMTCHACNCNIFGCPYNFHPEKPWLRRTIRGLIASSLVITSPVVVVGAITAAVTVLPPFAIYRLIKHLREKRSSYHYQWIVTDDRHFQLLNEFDEDHPIYPDDMLQALREQFEGLIDQRNEDSGQLQNNNDSNDDVYETVYHSNLQDDNEVSVYGKWNYVFSNMDVENLFKDLNIESSVTINNDNNNNPNARLCQEMFCTAPSTPVIHRNNVIRSKLNRSKSLHDVLSKDWKLSRSQLSNSIDEHLQ